ncbi:MAG: hypothetical protein HY805_02160 [Nitrospirae bacterium]|nr:hypothetical protein [Nitrospirota bacterium]
MENRKLLKIVALSATVIFILTFTSSCQADQWILFHDKEIKGSVIDVESGKPIERAIVVGMWELTQIPGEGFGGYAKILLSRTDKEGNFTIPSWTTFKPWKLACVMHGLAPKIVIYKPGYKVYWSHKIARAGYPDDMSKTEEEKKRIKEENSINPAKLKGIHTGEERIENLETMENAGRLYDLIDYLSKSDSIVLIEAIKKEYLLLPTKFRERFIYLEQIEKRLSEAKK